MLSSLVSFNRRRQTRLSRDVWGTKSVSSVSTGHNEPRSASQHLSSLLVPSRGDVFIVLLSMREGNERAEHAYPESQTSITSRIPPVDWMRKKLHQPVFLPCLSRCTALMDHNCCSAFLVDRTAGFTSLCTMFIAITDSPPLQTPVITVSFSPLLDSLLVPTKSTDCHPECLHTVGIDIPGSQQAQAQARDGQGASG